MVVAPEVIRVQEEEDATTGLVPDPRRLLASDGTREEQLESVRYWYRGDSFCITHGGDAAWAGADGTIHST